MSTPTATQRFFLRLLPWWAGAIEAESRSWVATCACGSTFSVWDAGGIRFRASGEPTRLLRCPACGEVAMRKVQRRT